MSGWTGWEGAGPARTDSGTYPHSPTPHPSGYQGCRCLYTNPDIRVLADQNIALGEKEKISHYYFTIQNKNKIAFLLFNLSITTELSLNLPK